MPDTKTQETPAPLCINCRHYRKSSYRMEHCLARARIETNLVTGNKYPVGVRDAFLERSVTRGLDREACGPEGRNFQAKAEDPATPTHRSWWQRIFAAGQQEATT